MAIAVDSQLLAESKSDSFVAATSVQIAAAVVVGDGEWMEGVRDRPSAPAIALALSADSRHDDPLLVSLCAHGPFNDAKEKLLLDVVCQVTNASKVHILL